MCSYYDRAVQLSAVYIAASYEIYTALSAGKDFTDQKIRFERSSAMPTCRVRSSTIS